jgi:hypothetical protein
LGAAIAVNSTARNELQNQRSAYTAWQRVWETCGLSYESVCINIDTTVSTVYGDIEGSRKGHNTKHRGKKGLRPILIFLEKTREYLCGTQRQGSTMRDEELAKLIRDIHKYLPACVRKVIVRGDAEFIGGLMG